MHDHLVSTVVTGNKLVAINKEWTLSVLQPVWQPSDVVVGVSTAQTARPKRLAVYALQQSSSVVEPLPIKDFDILAAQLHAIQQEDASGHLACWLRVSKGFPVPHDQQSLILVHIQLIAKETSALDQTGDRYRFAGWLMQPDAGPCIFVMSYRPRGNDNGYGCLKLFRA